MNFDLDNLNPGAVFYFDDSTPEKGSVTLRACPADVLSDMEKKTTTRRVEYKRGQRFEVVDRREDRWKELFYDYVIVGWENIKANGQPLECNAENKLKLMGQSPAFAAFVADSLEKLNNDIVDRKELVEKN